MSDSIFLPTVWQNQRRLELTMTPTADRWLTSVSVHVQGASYEFLRSIEGDGNSTWPPSPPIQDPLQQESDVGPFVAGVGMAGSSHWSIVIASVPDTAALDFDFACRVKTLPTWLGSQYSLVDGTDSVTAGQTCVALTVQRVGLSIKSTTDAVAACVVQQHGQQLDVRATLPEACDRAVTLRWKYRISINE